MLSSILRRAFSTSTRARQQAPEDALGALESLVSDARKAPQQVRKLPPFPISSRFPTSKSYSPGSFTPSPSPTVPPASARAAPAPVILPPLDELSFSPNTLISYVSTMGKIQSRRKTGLQWKQQRKMGRAVRRARESGLLGTFAVVAGTRRF